MLGRIARSISLRFTSGATPNNHFAPRPHRLGIELASGALVVVVAVQLFVPGLYFRRCSPIVAVITCPDDHFAPRPHCRMKGSMSRRVGGRCSCPIIRVRVYDPPVLKYWLTYIHPTRSSELPPHGCVFISAGRSILVLVRTQLFVLGS